MTVPATVPPSPPDDPATQPFRRGTLGRRLVLRVTALVALVAILLSTAAGLATRQLLVGQVDKQLTNVSGRLQRDPGNGPDGGPGRGLLQSGQPIGTLFAAVSGPRTLDSGRLAERNQRYPLPAEVVQVLQRIPADGHKLTITVPGLGRYRVVAYRATIFTSPGSDGIDGSVVVGIPVSEIDHTLVELTGVLAVLSLIAILVTVVAARTLVARSLRPLNRVAATAQQVSRLPLDRGEVALAVRVPPDDANPDSEVGRVGQAFNHMLNNVEDALAARQASEVKVRQFVADASHELRNPLAAIRGYAELTRRSRADLPADTAYAMARVESEAERMSRLVEDLLLLARLDSGPDLQTEPTDLSEIVLNAVSDARAAGPDHVWLLDVPDEPILALADRHRLHQVVANLLANARTHTPPGTRVRAAVSTTDDTAVLRVSDNGPGIPEAIRDQVFERFTRADVSRMRNATAPSGGSTGLGLAIVAAVVDAHAGSVSVTSEPGHTEFVVRLPLAVSPAHVGPGPDMLAPH